jgi:hypothetical protein
MINADKAKHLSTSRVARELHRIEALLLDHITRDEATRDSAQCIVHKVYYISDLDLDQLAKELDQHQYKVELQRGSASARIVIRWGV